MPDQKSRSTLAGQLALSGFVFPFDISKFIDRAITAGVDDPFSYAYGLIVRSKVFRRTYRGIFRSNGTLKMTPAEYEAYVDQASAAANAAGFSVSRRQIGAAIQGNKSLDEFSFGIRAAREIKANANVLNTFNQTLKAKGLRPLSSADQIFDFLLGRGSAEVYDLYERSAIRGAFEDAGLDISRVRAKQIAQQTAGVTTVEEALEKTANIRELLDMADPEIRSFLEGRDPQRALEAIEFGLANAERLRPLVERAVRQRQANVEDRGPEGRLSLDERGPRPVVVAPRRSAGF